ncbi:MAG: hypothetical protein QOE33_1791 [Acidobacteriota bacterium]|nr:hypothetical protein [Acidobacteriota bacterium]
MLLLIAGIIIIALAGSFLLALVSDAFADALSSSVEAAFDFVEYRAALRRAGRRVNEPHVDKIAYASSQTRMA